MTDTKILLEHLQEYSKQLSGHLLVLEERHETLGAAWAALREVYEGTGAEVFAEAFEAASGRLRDYATAGAEISRLLAREVEKLRVIDVVNPGV